MSDERLRELERAASTGTPVDQAAYLRERLRVGEVTSAELLAQAGAGDEAALMALDMKLPQVRMIESLGGLGRKPRDSAAAERAIRAYYAAIGFEPVRQALIKGSSKLVFKPRVVEEYRGEPGAWRKYRSWSKLQLVDSLLAAAAGPAGGAELKEKREVQKTKVEARRAKEQAKRNVLRAAAVLLSLDLTPEERLASFVDRRTLEPLAREIAVDAEAQLDSEATSEQIDAMLSVDAPPIFLPNDERRDADWPLSYKWRDATSGFDIEVKRRSGNRSASIIIGNVPVDPVTGNIIAARMSLDDEGYTGIAGAIRVGIYSDDVPQAQLYFIQSAKKRQGVARRMIRVFCRIVRAYGFTSFVILGVNEESAAMALGLDAEGELKIIGRKGSNVFVTCVGALEDPRQQRLFGPQPKLNR